MWRPSATIWGRAGRGWQIVLRELQTLSGHPGRLLEWTTCVSTRAAIEMAGKYA